MSENYLTGWGNGKESLAIYRMPEVRKSWALWYQTETFANPLAYFRSEEHARIAADLLDKIIQSRSARTEGDK